MEKNKKKHSVLGTIREKIFLDMRGICACIKDDEFATETFTQKLKTMNGKGLYRIEEVEKFFELDEDKLLLYALFQIQKSGRKDGSGIGTQIVELLNKKPSAANKSIYLIDTSSKTIEEICLEKQREKNRDKSGYEKLIRNISVSDVDEVIFADKVLSGYITNMIIGDKPNPLEESLKLNENGSLYYNEILKYIKQFIHKVDYNKLLLISAYRTIELLENYNELIGHDITDQQIINAEKNLNIIYQILKNSKVSITQRIESRVKKKDEKINYNVQCLSNDLKNFIGNRYYTNNQKEDIKKLLIDGEIELSKLEIDLFNLIDMTEEQLLKVIKNSEENFLWYVNNSKIANFKIVNAFKQYENPSIDLIEFLISKVDKRYVQELYNDGNIRGEKLLKLKEKVNIEELFDIKNLLKKDKIQTLNNLINDQLLDIDTVRQYVTEDIVKEKIENENIDIIMALCENNLVSLEKIREFINDDTIIREFENGDQAINKLLKLYSANIVTDEAVNLLIDEYKLDGKIVDSYINDDIIDYEKVKELDININLEEIELIIEQEKEKILKNETKRKDEDKEEINEEKPSKAKTLIAHMIEKRQVSEEKLDKLYKEGIITEEDLFDFAQRGYFSEITISKIYTNYLISEEKLNELVKIGIINEHWKNEMQSILKYNKFEERAGILEYIEIENFQEPNEKIKPNSGNGGNFQGNNVQPKEVIKKSTREELFSSIGAKKILFDENKRDNESPFYNYDFYAIPDKEGKISLDSVVIAERYYHDRLSKDKKLITGNATYLFKLQNLIRIEKKNKREIIEIATNGTDKEVYRTFHRSNWASRTINKIEKVTGQNLMNEYCKWICHKIDSGGENININKYDQGR